MPINNYINVNINNDDHHDGNPMFAQHREIWIGFSDVFINENVNRNYRKLQRHSFTLTPRQITHDVHVWRNVSLNISRDKCSRQSAMEFESKKCGRQKTELEHGSFKSVESINVEVANAFPHHFPSFTIPTFQSYVRYVTITMCSKLTVATAFCRLRQPLSRL